VSGNEITFVGFLSIIAIVFLVNAIRFNRKSYEEFMNNSFGSGEQAGAFYLNVMKFFPYGVQKAFRMILAFGVISAIIYFELMVHNFV
jgi:hypothetical protein